MTLSDLQLCAVLSLLSVSPFKLKYQKLIIVIMAFAHTWALDYASIVR